jgi:endo-1,4-beta-xylanase
VKKKAQSLKVAKVVTFSNKGAGTLSYKKKSGNKKIAINKKTGKVTVKKGLKKGTYKVKAIITAAGDANHKAATVPVTFKVKVS